MGIDWEEILGAEGEDIPEAYDSLVDGPVRHVSYYNRNYDPCLDYIGTPCPQCGTRCGDNGCPLCGWRPGEEKKEKKEKKAEGRKENSQRMPVPLGLWRPEHELEALRKQLEKIYHQKFHWKYDTRGMMQDLADTRDCLVRLTRVRDRWCLAYPICEENQTYWDVENPSPSSLLDVLELEVEGSDFSQGPDAGWVLNSDGIPVSLIDNYDKVYWDIGNFEDNEITLVSDIYVLFSGVELRLREMWYNHHLIWNESSKSKDDDYFNLDQLMWRSRLEEEK